MADKNGAIDGAIHVPLLMQPIAKYGCVSIQPYIRSKLNSSSTTTSTDPGYIAFYYDILTNLSVIHSDTRILLNKELTAAGYKSGGLGLRCKNPDSLT